MSNLAEDAAEFVPLLRGIFRALVTVQRDVMALQIALLNSSAISDDEYDAAVKAVDKRMKPIFDMLDQMDPKKMLDLLANFEGPVQ